MADKDNATVVEVEKFESDSPIQLVIENRNGQIFSPPVKDEVKIEWERVGVPGKLTFTTVKVDQSAMSFWEGDRVQFYYKEELIFVGYVFTKKRDKQHHIEVTCYDQLRYLKNKFSYVFEKKTATEIIKSLCNDYKLKMGDFEDSKYKIPALAEENKTAFDIVCTATEETLTNTGNMFVLYDDAGELVYKNCANMTVDTIIADDTSENFDYTSSIDEETYNSIVLYYTPEVQATAQTNTNGSTQYSTSNGGSGIVGSSFIWPLSGYRSISSPFGYRNCPFHGREFHTGCDIPAPSGTPIMASKGGRVTISTYGRSYGNYVQITHPDGSWTKYCHMSRRNCSVGQNVSQRQVIGYVGTTGDSTGNHLHFEICINGTRVNPVSYARSLSRSADIIPMNTYAKEANPMAESSASSSSGETGTADVKTQVFTAMDEDHIKEWGLLRYFEEVDSASIGKNKAESLLKLYNRKTRTLKITDAFGDVRVRGGTLIPVFLDLGDLATSNYMLVEKVTHKFTRDSYFMDLELEGAWENT